MLTYDTSYFPEMLVLSAGTLLTWETRLVSAETIFVNDSSSYSVTIRREISEKYGLSPYHVTSEKEEISESLGYHLIFNGDS
jgi:hypothetical protein